MNQPHSHTTWEPVYEPASFPYHLGASVWTNLIPIPLGRQCMSQPHSQAMWEAVYEPCGISECGCVCTSTTTLVIEWWEDSRNNTTLHKMFSSSFFFFCPHCFMINIYWREEISMRRVILCLPTIAVRRANQERRLERGCFTACEPGQHCNIRQSCWKSLQE